MKLSKKNIQFTLLSRKKNQSCELKNQCPGVISFQGLSTGSSQLCGHLGAIEDAAASVECLILQSCCIVMWRMIYVMDGYKSFSEESEIGLYNIGIQLDVCVISYSSYYS